MNSALRLYAIVVTGAFGALIGYISLTGEDSQRQLPERPDFAFNAIRTMKGPDFIYLTGQVANISEEHIWAVDLSIDLLSVSLDERFLCQGQLNRIPKPGDSGDFVVMCPLLPDQVKEIVGADISVGATIR